LSEAARSTTVIEGAIPASSEVVGRPEHELTDADRLAGYEVRRFPGSDYIDVIVPWDQVTTWRAVCECGWTGSECPAVTDVKYGYRDCPEDLADRVFLPEWQAHIEPFEALHDLGGLVEDLRQVECGIADKVLLARSGGASWSQVGRALGVTKQAAQQRWG
jgi:hypothetical protein